MAMSRFENAYVLNVMSSDHPGIVAAVTGAVESLRGNIDACSQTVLGGYFTLIMIVSLSERIDPERLAERVREAGLPCGTFHVMARFALATGAETRAKTGAKTGVGTMAESCDRFVITAFGRDQPGVVRTFSQYLAAKDINIVDLYGDLRGDDFVLIGQVEVPAHWDICLMQADLEEMGQDLGFTVKLQHENIFVATNQLRLAAT
jgi:predicted amino acid-binding ACT domain protein